jgi:hypothetical protein
VLTLKETLEQVPSPSARLPGVATIFLELSLHRFKDFRLN